MFRVRKTWLVLVAVALAWTAQASAASLPALRAASSAADRWIVDDADFVLVINMKQLAGAELMKKGGMETLNGVLKSCPQAQGIIEATGLQPFRDIDSILISGILGVKTSDARGLLVVSGRFDPDKAVAVARKKSDVEVIRDGKLELIKLKIQDQPVYAAFLDSKTLVVTQSRESTKSWVTSGGKKSARISPALEKGLRQFKGTESLTLALGVNDEMKKLLSRVPQFAVSGPKLQALTAGLTVTDTVELKVVGSTSDRKAAGQLQNSLTQLKGVAEVMLQADETAFNKTAADLLAQVKIGSDQLGVHISCKLTRDQLEKLTRSGK